MATPASPADESEQKLRRDVQDRKLWVTALELGSEPCVDIAALDIGPGHVQ